MGSTDAKTLAERFGFKDSDLKTPKHDEIMLWLDGAMDGILQRTYADIDGDWSQSEIDSTVGWIARETHWTNDRIMEALGPLPAFSEFPAKIFKKVWERPITTGKDNKFIVGFIDLDVEYGVAGSLSASTNYKDYKHTVSPWQAARTSRRACFEVKSSIDSLGELIRQIRMYESHILPASRYEGVPTAFYVVCPDDRFKEPLAAQGIRLIRAGDETAKLF